MAALRQRGDKYRVCFDYGVDRKACSQIPDVQRNATRSVRSTSTRSRWTGTQVMPSEYAFAQWLDYWYDNIIVPQIEQTTSYGHQAS